MMRSLFVCVVLAAPLLAQPAVTAIAPPANAPSVTRNSSVSAQFSTPMAGASASSFPVHSSQRGRRAGNYSGAASTTLGFDPAQDFVPGETVSATLTTGLLSTGAVPLGQARVWQFTAKAGLAPRVFNYKSPFTGFAGNSQAMNSLAAGDLDGDGDVDWVTGFEQHNQCLIHLNNGDGTFPFSAPALSLAGNCRQCAVLADMDNDGDLDIVLGCNGTSNQNYVFLNDGSGGFPAYRLFGTGSDDTWWIGCTDMDGDGDNDIVCGNAAQQSLVYLNDGAANFGASLPFGAASGLVLGGSLGDIDGDFDIDLVSVSGGGTVSVWFNNGAADLGSAATFVVSGGFFECCVLADLDGDADLDLALGHGGGANPIYFNNGSGSYSAAGFVTMDAQNTLELVAGDFDGDGDIDLVACNAGAAGTNQTYVYINDGAGTFTRDAAIGSATSLTPCGVAADLDADGDLDFILGRRSGGVHEVRYNASQQPTVTNPSLPAAQEGVNYSVPLTATGGTAPYSWYLTSAPAWLTLGLTTGLLSGTPPTGIAPAQFTVSVQVFDAVNEFSSWTRTLDVFDGNPTITTVSLPNAQEGSAYLFTLSAVQGQPPYAWTLVSAPAWLSIGATSGTLSGTPQVASGGSSVNVTVQVTDALSANSQKLFSLGIDPPGPPDLVSTSPAGNAIAAVPTTNVTATFNTTMAPATSSGFVVHSGVRGTAGGSYFGGGTTALVFAPTSPFRPGEEVEVSLTTSLVSSAAIAPAAPFVFRFRAATAASPANLASRSGTLTGNPEVTLDVAAGDIDGDGLVDIVQGNGAGTMRQCYWYKNNGDGSFTQRFTLGTLDNIHAVLLADLDNDGDLDFVQGSNGGLTAAFLNNGTGAFGSGYTIANGSQVLALAVGDIDGDGDLDIVSGESLGTVYRNNGGGSFTTVDYMNISNGKALALADLDSDGDLDCIQVCDNQDRYFLNDGTGDFAFNGSALGAAATASRGVCAADFDGDGDVDVLVSAANAPAYLYLNDGAGLFTQGAGTGSGGATASTAGDFDGDGDLDFVEGRAGAQCAMYVNNGAGSFSTGTSFGVSSQHCESLASADFDGDGKLDVVSGNSDAGIAEISYVYLNDVQSQVVGSVAAGAGNPVAASVGQGSTPPALHFVVSVNSASTASATISRFNVQVSVTGGAPAFAQLESATLWRGNGQPAFGGTQIVTILRNAMGWSENSPAGQATLSFGAAAALNEGIAPGTARDYWVQLAFAPSGTVSTWFTYAASIDQSVGTGLSGTFTSGIVGTAQGGILTLQASSGGGGGSGDGSSGGCTTSEPATAGWLAFFASVLLGAMRSLRRREAR